MSVEEENGQETDLRDYPQINKAIDNINLKLLDLENKLERIGVVYIIIIAYLQGKLNGDEVERIVERLMDSEDEVLEEFSDSTELLSESNEGVHSITEMLSLLEDERWSD